MTDDTDDPRGPRRYRPCWCGGARTLRSHHFGTGPDCRASRPDRLAEPQPPTCPGGPGCDGGPPLRVVSRAADPTGTVFTHADGATHPDRTRLLAWFEPDD